MGNKIGQHFFYFENSDSFWRKMMQKTVKRVQSSEVPRGRNHTRKNLLNTRKNLLKQAEKYSRRNLKQKKQGGIATTTVN